MTHAVPHALPEANRVERRTGFLSPKTLTREAFKVVSDLDLPIRPAAVRLAVSTFIDHGHAPQDFAEWFASYADPTGETAVRNVYRDRGY
jgi:hypothetical protein